MSVVQMIIFWDSNGRNMKGILCIAKVFRFSGPLQKTNLLTAVALEKNEKNNLRYISKCDGLE